jgi:hypothetical protein
MTKQQKWRGKSAESTETSNFGATLITGYLGEDIQTSSKHG